MYDCKVAIKDEKKSHFAFEHLVMATKIGFYQGLRQNPLGC